MSHDILFLTWSPPSFYSDDIPQGSITTYHVYVQSKDGSVITDVNTTDTFYNNGFSNNFTICGIYTIIVTAFTEQYRSIDVSSTKNIQEVSWHNLFPNIVIDILL